MEPIWDVDTILKLFRIWALIINALIINHIPRNYYFRSGKIGLMRSRVQFIHSLVLFLPDYHTNYPISTRKFPVLWPPAVNETNSEAQPRTPKPKPIMQSSFLKLVLPCVSQPSLVLSMYPTFRSLKPGNWFDGVAYLFTL